MVKKPVTVTMSLWLILFIAVIWLGFGGLVASGAHPAMPDEPTVRLILTAGSLITSVALFILWSMLSQHNPMGYYMSLVLFAVITLVTFLDDVGWVDFLFVGLSLVVLILLIKDRKWYLGKPLNEG